MLTCVLNLTNSNTRYIDLEWYKLTKSTNTIERMDPYEDRINFVIHTTGNTTNSTLNITNAAISYTGYYWVETPSLIVCNVSLTVLTGTFYVNCTLQNSCTYFAQLCSYTQHHTNIYKFLMLYVEYFICSQSFSKLYKLLHCYRQLKKLLSKNESNFICKQY